MLINGHPRVSFFQLGECQLLESLSVLVQSVGLNSTWSPVVYRDIALSINTQLQFKKLQLC